MLALIAILPVANAARNSAAWTRRKAREADCAAPQPRPFAESAVLATAIVFAILVAIVGRQAGDSLAFVEPREGVMFMSITIILAFLFALLQAAGLCRYAYAISAKATRVIPIFLAVIWGAPPLVDFALEVMGPPHMDASRSWVFGLSPVGTWILTFGRAGGPILPGLIFQGVVASFCLLLSRSARR